MAGGGCEAGVPAAGLLLVAAGGRGGGRHPGPHHRVVALALATPRQRGGQRGQAAAVRTWTNSVDTSAMSSLALPPAVSAVMSASGNLL